MKIAFPPPLDPLRSGRDISAAMRARQSGHSTAVSVHARRRAPADGPPRATVVAGRAVGGAVARNRAKRRLRPLLRAWALPDGVDLVVVARAPETATVPADELATMFARACTVALRKVAA